MSEPVHPITVGLEIHRQLDTDHKLFCSCPTQLTEESPENKFFRRLRPTQSELGQVDQAALFEFHRGKGIIYETDRKTSCLVEMDEEPPNKINSEAIEVCLTAALLMNAKPVDEIHVMRKIVIDGSNTTGFQRTSVVALNGVLTINGSTIPIDQISLEEDAARKTSQARDTTGYRIDRLGIPLIEVTTAPVLHSPSEVERVALAIGNVLRYEKRQTRTRQCQTGSERIYPQRCSDRDKRRPGTRINRQSSSTRSRQTKQSAPGNGRAEEEKRSTSND